MGSLEKERQSRTMEKEELEKYRQKKVKEILKKGDKITLAESVYLAKFRKKEPEKSEK
jgi:hypothetical protein